MREYFTDHEMSNLWGSLKRHINSSDAKEETKSHWTTLCQKGRTEGKNRAKSDALALKVAYPTTWEDTWIHQCKSVRRSIKKSKENGYFYKGELEQIHGKEEANRFILKGKFEESEDSDGDVIFKKTQRKEVDEFEQSMQMDLKSSSQVQDAEQKTKIEEAMREFWANDGFGKGGARSSGDGQDQPHLAIEDLKKRPAGAKKATPKAKSTPEAIAPAAAEHTKPKQKEEHDESEIENDQVEKIVKDPIEEAQGEVRKMAGNLNKVSCRLNATIARTKKSPLTQALVSSLKQKRTNCELLRKNMLKIAVDKKIVPTTVKKELIGAAKEIKDAVTLEKMAKPFAC